VSLADYPGINPKISERRKAARCALQEAKQRARERNQPIFNPGAAPPVPKAIRVEGVDVRSREFLRTYAWRTLRYKALKEGGSRCECCGASPERGIRLNVDHIQPRKRRPDLALDPYNLQVLCDDCNAGKGNWDETDWR
jgi:5-methylcytosine-specific restriction endonuclease McrA